MIRRALDWLGAARQRLAAHINFGGGTHMKFSISRVADWLDRVAKELEAVRREIGE